MSLDFKLITSGVKIDIHFANEIPSLTEKKAEGDLEIAKKTILIKFRACLTKDALRTNEMPK